jgi:membrane-bound lytic murein transglycosylase C
VKKISLSLTIISISLLINWDIIAKMPQEQSFDDIDRMLDQQFKQKSTEIDSLYNAYTKAIDDAFNGVTKKIEVKWPNNVKLPTKSTWVGYSKNLQTRSIVDYEAGEVVIETRVTDNNLNQAKLQLEAMTGQLTSPTTEPIEKLDIFSQAINENLNKKGIQPSIKPLKSKNILKHILPEIKLLNVAAVDINKLTAVKEITPLISSIKAEQRLPTTKITPTNVSPPTIDTSPVMTLKTKSTKLIPSIPPVEVANKIKEPTIKLDLVKTANGSLLKMTIKFVNNYQKVLLANNFDDVKKFSKKYDVAISVILAIIETESSYNPRAISRVPAFGLMQLVPKTAGIDAHNYVHGQKKILSPDYLFDETNNLQLGTAYFKLLKSRYLRKIEDPQSRFYCAVSSYNTGVGNLAKTFTGKKNLSKAAKVINTMTADEVYKYLLKNLPAEETRNYLKKIVNRRAKYVHFDSEIKEI